MYANSFDYFVEKPTFVSSSPVRVLNLGGRSLGSPGGPDDHVGTIITNFSKTLEVVRIQDMVVFTPAVLNCHGLAALFFNSADFNAEFLPSRFTADHVRGLIQNCPQLTTLHTNMILGSTMRSLVDVPRLCEVVTAWFPLIPSAFTLDDLEFLMRKKGDLCVDMIVVWSIEGDVWMRELNGGMLEALVEKFKGRLYGNAVTYQAMTGDESGFLLATDQLWIGGSAVWWSGDRFSLWYS
ncbi:hypothetical protein HDU76_006545 [Blyttiomyces sp. JEL0837]|nr:hypothetical protein HDU76_006545 [Blyttiomyces sp. JEL0837]